MTAPTKGLAAGAVQKGIYAVLSAAASVTSLVGQRIYDAVPQNAAEPYLVISGITEVSDDTLEDGDAGIGAEVLFTIDAVSDDQKGAAGFKTVQDIASAVKVLLHDQTFSIEGWTLVGCEHEDTTILPDQDETGRPKRHSSSSYRVRAEAA